MLLLIGSLPWWENPQSSGEPLRIHRGSVATRQPFKAHLAACSLIRPQWASSAHHPGTKGCTVPTHTTHVCTYDQPSLKCVCLCLNTASPRWWRTLCCLLVLPVSVSSPPSSSRGVGCILYEMATGRPMFPGATVKEELHLVFRLMGKLAAHYHNILQAMLIPSNIWSKNESYVRKP